MTRRRVRVTIVLALLLGVFLCGSEAQGPRTLALQTAATTGNGTPLDTEGYSLVSLAVVGVAAGADRVVTFQVSLDSVQFTNVLCRQVALGTSAATVTASGTTVTQWTCPVGGFRQLRAVVSGGTTGAVTVTASALDHVAPPYPL